MNRKEMATALRDLTQLRLGLGDYYRAKIAEIADFLDPFGGQTVITPDGLCLVEEAEIPLTAGFHEFALPTIERGDQVTYGYRRMHYQPGDRVVILRRQP